MARVPEHQGPNAARGWCALLWAIAPGLAPRLAPGLACGLALTVLLAAPAAWAGEVGRPLPRPAPGAGAGPGPGAPPPACRYTITLINSPLTCGSNPESLSPKAINRNGDIVGERYCSITSRRPFFAPASGGYQPWANPSGAFDLSVGGLNSMGEIAGEAQFTTAPIRGYLRKSTGEYQILGFPPAGTFSTAHGVSDGSLVVGTWGNQQTGPGLVPCVWLDGVLTDLATILGNPLGEVHAINASGQMTGWTGTLSHHQDGRAFVLEETQVTILPATPGANTSQGYAINDHGDVCGRGWLPGGGWRAFAYIDGEMLALGMLPGTTGSIARAINDAQIVVGSSGSKGFVWQDGVMRSLTDLIPSSPAYTIQNAYGIHTDGRIIAQAAPWAAPTTRRGVILTPVYPSAADLNLDCHVNGLDLAMLLGAWGLIDPAADSSADLNQDGVVNGIDLALLLGEWG